MLEKVKVAVYFTDDDGSFVFCEYPGYLISGSLAVSYDNGTAILGNLVPSVNYPGYYEPTGHEIELSSEFVREEVITC